MECSPKKKSVGEGEGGEIFSTFMRDMDCTE